MQTKKVFVKSSKVENTKASSGLIFFADGRLRHLELISVHLRLSGSVEWNIYLLRLGFSAGTPNKSRG